VIEFFAIVRNDSRHVVRLYGVFMGLTAQPKSGPYGVFATQMEPFPKLSSEAAREQALQLAPGEAGQFVAEVERRSLDCALFRHRDLLQVFAIDTTNQVWGRYALMEPHDLAAPPVKPCFPPLRLP
jgi:hypothetical protein